MQAAPTPYLPLYQNLYHLHPIGPQDHELKREYLSLLPPQQVIDICLSLDPHVPPYVKSTLWPIDLSAAVQSLRKSGPGANGNTDAVLSASAKDKERSVPEERVMDSLERPPEESESRIGAENQSVGENVGPSEDQQNEGSTSTSAVSATASATTPIPTPTPTTAQFPTPAPTSSSAPPSAPAPPTQTPQQSPYPHQPYGYPQHPTPYPHSPYYPPPPGYPPYPPSNYPYPPVNGFPHAAHPAPPPHTGYPAPPHPNAMYPHVAQPPPPHPGHPDQTSDDLPSYEEMIVEALQESNDPEGCAPKDLFLWMAARYPVQANFRPSASQALQKAYKRGRFEKSANGKYRLSATWEGGNTSKRTTRRPQTQAQSQPNAFTHHHQSPFTHAPLVHHHQTQHPHQANPQAYPGQPFPYPPYGATVPPYPPQPPSQPQISQATQPFQPHNQPPAAPETSNPPRNGTVLDADMDKDAYEAAQNILKAINFGNLFKFAQDGETGNDKRTEEVSMDQLTTLLVQAQSGLLQADERGSGSNNGAGAGGEQTMAPSSTSTRASALPMQMQPTADVSVGTSGVQASTNVRAELQAQLALLAAQLAELGQENAASDAAASEGGVNNATVVQFQTDVQADPAAPIHGSTSYQNQQQSSGSIPEPPVMDALLPPETTDHSQPSQLRSQSLPPVQPEQNSNPPSRQGDIPIDPALQSASGTYSNSDATQPSPGEAVTSTNTDGSATRKENMQEEEEEESNDEDMEEII